MQVLCVWPKSIVGESSEPRIQPQWQKSEFWGVKVIAAAAVITFCFQNFHIYPRSKVLGSEDYFLSQILVANFRCFQGDLLLDSSAISPHLCLSRSLIVRWKDWNEKNILRFFFSVVVPLHEMLNSYKVSVWSVWHFILGSDDRSRPNDCRLVT